MIKGIFAIFISFLFILFLGLSQPIYAEENSANHEVILKAKVVEIIESGEKDIDVGGEIQKRHFQEVKVVILEGDQEGTQIVIDHGQNFTINEAQRVVVGQVVVLNKFVTENGDQYQIVDSYRLDIIAYIALVFFISVILISGWRGLGSIVGLLISLLVVVGFIVPQILSGSDPLLISIIGSLVIMVTTIYLAHGFSRQTTIAVVSTFITLTLAGVLSVVFVGITHLSGLGNDDAFSLQFGQLENINFRGLLLGGMIIGFLGVLDDITTGLAATVFEINRHSPKLSFSGLIKSSLNVGREHISSLVNTLVLAYAGASLPVFILIVLNPQKYPLWFIINSEMISEEIIRTLAGSFGLILAVPITTFLAAYCLKKSSKV